MKPFTIRASNGVSIEVSVTKQLGDTPAGTVRFSSGEQVTIGGRSTTGRFLLAALHRLNELGVTNLGDLDDFTQMTPETRDTSSFGRWLDAMEHSPTPGTATTSTYDLNDSPARIARVGHVAGLAAELRGRISELEATVLSDVEVAAPRNVTVGLSVLGKRVSHIEGVIDRSTLRMEAASGAFAGLQARVDGMDLNMVKASTDHKALTDRVARLESALQSLVATPAATSAVEESWLFQVINPTLDAIEQAITGWRKMNGEWTAAGILAGRLQPGWNSSVLRHARACNRELDATFSRIDDFHLSFHSFAESIAFYTSISEVLTKFAVDTCARLGIPPAPRNF